MQAEVVPMEILRLYRASRWLQENLGYSQSHADECISSADGGMTFTDDGEARDMTEDELRALLRSRTDISPEIVEELIADTVMGRRAWDATART